MAAAVIANCVAAVLMLVTTVSVHSDSHIDAMLAESKFIERPTIVEVLVTSMSVELYQLQNPCEWWHSDTVQVWQP